MWRLVRPDFNFAMKTIQPLGDNRNPVVASRGFEETKHAEPNREIVSQCLQLDKTCERLEIRIQALAKRLDPVLVPAPANPGSGESPEPCRCKLAGILESVNQRICNVITIIDALESTVQL